MQDFNELTDRLTLIYGTNGRGMKISTLTLTLNMFQDVFYRINEILYPGESVEFIIERIEEGSIWATIKKAGLSAAAGITFGVAGNIIYAKINPPLNPQVDGVVIIVEDKAVIKIGDKTFSIPVDSLEAYQKIRQDKNINSRIVEVFGKLNSDERIHYFGLAADNTRVNKPIIIPKERFSDLIQTIDIKTQEINHPDLMLEVINTDYQDKLFSGTFKWGYKIIHATITDHQFTNSPGMRKKIFEPGKLLNIQMIETKSNDYYTHELIHSRFEIRKVYTS